MKMGAGLFWGAFLLLLGVALIIRVVFNVEFPIVKVVFGIMLVLLGIKIIFGKTFFSPEDVRDEDTIFREQVYKQPEKGREYSVVFGKGVYDFTGVDLSEGPYRTKISTVFGGSKIIIPSDKPVRIQADAVFAGAELPGGNTAAFGSSIFENELYQPDSAAIEIQVDVVFGGVQVVQR